MIDWRDRIRRAFDGLKPRPLADDHRGEAAVLVSIVTDREPAFLLTRRSQTVSTHKGHVAFPGGMREDDDVDLIATALRETREELGVLPESVEVVGRFHEYMAATGHRVCPVVGLLEPAPALTPDPAEVEYAFEVPFQLFLETPPRIEEVYWRGGPHNLYYYEFDGDLVWGLTAAIIRDFLAVLHPDNPLLG